jgi:capsular exopolysaccharide synthesis family protein
MRGFALASARLGEEMAYPLPQPREIETIAAARRRWRLVGGIAAAGSLAGYLFCQTLTPLYSSKASVMIDPREPKRMAVSADPTSALPPSEEAVRKNEIAIIRSRKLAELVIAQLQLDRDAEFNRALRRPSWMEDALEQGRALASRITTTAGIGREPEKMRSQSPELRIRNEALDLFLERLGTTSTDASRVIEIRFSSQNPEHAAHVANAVAEQYIQQKLKQDVAEAEVATKALQRDIDGLNLKIRDAERGIERMRGEHRILPAADLKIMAERLSELNRQLVMATGDRVAAEGRLADLKSAQRASGAAGIAVVLNSPLIQRLQEGEVQISAKISELSKVHGDDHPRMIQARAQLDDFRAKIDMEVAKLAASYRSEFALAEAREAALAKLVVATKNEMAKANASEVDVRMLEREVDINRTLMKQLADRLNDTRADIDRKGPEARVISSAVVPHLPTFPPKLAITVIAFLFCVTGGTILAVVLERWDASIRSTAQLRQITAARVFGMLPAVRRAGRMRQSPPVRVIADRRSMFVEALRAIWFHIEFVRQGDAKTLLITSAVPREGKSSTAASLARLLALTGRKVAIVDGDLRHPSVHHALGLGAIPGVAEYVEAGASLDHVLQTDGQSGAGVVAAGAPLAPPADVLQSPRMAELLAELTSRFDSVIIDTPPLLAVHDAGILARYADMTVVVVRWGATRAVTFATAMQRLYDLGIPVGGVILSMVDRRRYSHAGNPDGEIFARGMRKYYSD